MTLKVFNCIMVTATNLFKTQSHRTINFKFFFTSRPSTALQNWQNQITVYTPHTTYLAQWSSANMLAYIYLFPKSWNLEHLQEFFFCHANRKKQLPACDNLSRISEALSNALSTNQLGPMRQFQYALIFVYDRIIRRDGLILFILFLWCQLNL